MIATALLATAFLIDTKHRLAALLVGFVVGLAFTIRLDIGLVAGITALTTTLCLLAFQSFKEVIYKGVIALAGFLIAAGPTLLYVQTHSDIVSYFIKGGYHADKSLLADLSVATGMGSQRDLLGIIGPVSLPAERLELTIELAEIDMRYASSIDATERNTLETTYGLTAAYARPDGQTWNYRLADTAQENLHDIVKDSRIEDTNGIDRTRMRIPPPRELYLSTALFGARLTPDYAAVLAYNQMIILQWGSL